MTENGALVAPGDSLGQLKDGFVPGAGTYEAGGKIVASLVGFTALKEKDGLVSIKVMKASICISTVVIRKKYPSRNKRAAVPSPLLCRRRGQQSSRE